MLTLIRNIHRLYGIEEANKPFRAGKEMADFPYIENAWVLIRDQRIEDYGRMPDVDGQHSAHDSDRIIDAAGKIVIPAFVDSHSHLVFAASREEEFVMKIQGKTYEEIAAAGGGILNSAAKLQKMPEKELYRLALDRLQEVIALGTGALEIKSGYGLTVEDELKMLRVIKRLKNIAPIPIKATFLGAHTFPAEYKNNREGYIKLIIDEMLPAIAKEGLADFIDVFCEQGFYTPEETERIVNAGKKHGLIPKIHGNQLGNSGGVQVAVKTGALSVDHLEHMGEEEIEALKGSKTMPVGLPNCSFYLRMPYTPGRQIIEAGLPLALASDYNPGSSPSGKMGFVVSLACIQMKLLPEEVFNAVTLNAAYAMGLEKELGSISKGKFANLIITKKIPSLAWIPYSFGSEWIDKVMIKGH
ncbi:MAG TPA: imidazolonepropionase [Bacteroidetes bacterium]|nr:imidazolonepropionase [Bacteroidota bacterium]